MSASRNVMIAENADGIPLCQPKSIGDTKNENADRIPHMQITLQDRLKKLIADKAISIAEAERLCDLSKDTLRKLINNPDQTPSTRTLALISKGFGVSQQWLLTGDESAPTSDETANLAGKLPTDARVDPTVVVPNTFDLPKNVEVRGTAAGSHLRGAFQFAGDTIDYVRRPPALMGAKDVYALYVEGSSMEPQFFPGDLIYVHPHKPARVGDPVVIQTKAGSDHEIEGTIGIYLRRTEKYIVIGKHNPKAEVQILRNDGTQIHKIMTLNELFGV